MKQAILVNGEPIRYDLVPVDYMAGGVRLYFESGIMPGSFLTAVLSNDLRGACERADENNKRALFDWVSWLYNYAPRGSWGSPEAVAAWSKERESERAK